MLRGILGRLKNESGMATLLVVGVLLVLTVLGFAIINRGTNEQVITGRQVDGTKALHVADAGVQQAVWRIEQQLITSGQSFTVNSNDLGGTAQVSVSAPGGGWYWVITSSGTVAGATRTVKTTLFNFSLWDVDMSTGSTLGGGNSSGAINGNASFTGPLYVQGGIALSGSANFEQGPLMIRDGSLQFGGSGTAGTQANPIKAYIHPVSDYPPAYTLRRPDVSVDPDLTSGPFYASSLMTDVPLINLPTMGSMSEFRQKAYGQSLVGLAVNFLNISCGEKVIDYNLWYDQKPTGSTIDLRPTTLLGLTPISFGFDLFNNQMTGTPIDSSNGVMNSFAYNKKTGLLGPYDHTIYLSHTGKPMTVYVDGNLNIGDGGDTFFSGVGTLVVNGNVTINGRLVANNRADFPAVSSMGIVANGTITANSGNHQSQSDPDYQGAWYASDAIRFTANNVGFVGTMISSVLDFEQNTHAWTNSQLSSNLPPDLPGANNKITVMSGWREVIK